MKPREMALLTLPSTAKENERIKSIILVRKGLFFFNAFMKLPSKHKNLKRVGYTYRVIFNTNGEERNKRIDNMIQNDTKANLEKLKGITEAR